MSLPKRGAPHADHFSPTSQILLLWQRSSDGVFVADVELVRAGGAN